MQFVVTIIILYKITNGVFYFTTDDDLKSLEESDVKPHVFAGEKYIAYLVSRATQSAVHYC